MNLVTSRRCCNFPHVVDAELHSHRAEPVVQFRRVTTAAFFTCRCDAVLARYWLLPSVSLVSTSRSAIQSELLSKCNLAVEHSASRHLPVTSWQYQYPSQQFPFHLSTGLRPVFLICAALFFSSKVRPTVHCFAARLSRYISAYSLVVRYWRIARKMKMRWLG